MSAEGMPLGSRAAAAESDETTSCTGEDEFDGGKVRGVSITTVRRVGGVLPRRSHIVVTFVCRRAVTCFRIKRL